MDRLWFHQCIHGLLSLSSSALRDVHAFCMEHPFQQNIRMVEASIDKDAHATDQTISGAFQLPDRKALFHVKSSGSVSFKQDQKDGLIPETTQMETSSVAISLSDDVPQDPTGARFRRMLPVYIRPEPETTLAEEDQEDHWTQLEELLNADTQDESEEDDMVVATGESESSMNDEPPRQSILDRLDLRIDDHAFGIPEQAAEPKRGFTEWLSGLSNPAGNGKDNLHVLYDEQSTDGKGKKKSKKARKEAKRLAKLSVKKKKVVATQTLAELLSKQGHIEDAIDMFERLCLIYPEKKAIFAARIETIKSSRP